MKQERDDGVMALGKERREQHKDAQRKSIGILEHPRYKRLFKSIRKGLDEAWEAWGDTSLHGWYLPWLSSRAGSAWIQRPRTTQAPRLPLIHLFIRLESFVIGYERLVRFENLQPNLYTLVIKHSGMPNWRTTLRLDVFLSVTVKGQLRTKGRIIYGKS